MPIQGYEVPAQDTTFHDVRVDSSIIENWQKQGVGSVTTQKWSESSRQLSLISNYFPQEMSDPHIVPYVAYPIEYWRVRFAHSPPSPLCAKVPFEGIYEEGLVFEAASDLKNTIIWTFLSNDCRPSNDPLTKM